jgi:hypothetical protein
VSSGENSTINIDYLECINSFIGVANKDGSQLILTNSKFKNIIMPFAVYKKKKAYENLKLSNSPNIHRPCSFMDFQKSLINYFKDKKELFSVNCSNEAKTSFSYPDDKNKQWILTVFENENIYRYDLYNKFFDDTNDYLLNDKNKKNLLKFLEMYSIKIDNF